MSEIRRESNEISFLATTSQFEDFELRLQFRLRGGVGNSGIQFRSQRVPNDTEVSGYQADIGEKYWGCLYDESRRNKVLVQAAPELRSALKLDDWNEYVVRAEGNRITLTMNGVKTVDYVEPDAAIPRHGLIAVQVHSGPALKVEFRNILIKRIPSKRPNVVFMLTDDQRWDCLGCMGHPHLKTPHIDRLAAEGILFQNAFCTTSLCSPSRASILSGLYAHSHGVTNNFTEYPVDLPSMPRQLQSYGYQTAYLANGIWVKITMRNGQDSIISSPTKAKGNTSIPNSIRRGP